MKIPYWMVAVVLGLWTNLQAENLILNGDFKDGKTGWKIGGSDLQNPLRALGLMTVSEEGAVIDVDSILMSKSKDKPGMVQLIQEVQDLEEGKSYVLTFKAKSELPCDKVIVALGHPDSSGASTQGGVFRDIKTSGEWQESRFAFRYSKERLKNPDSRLVLQFRIGLIEKTFSIKEIQLVPEG